MNVSLQLLKVEDSILSRIYGRNSKIDLYRLVHKQKKYKSRVGDQKIGVCGLLGKKRM
jgi:hypothetical protein